jgi:hypothetical protein
VRLRVTTEGMVFARFLAKRLAKLLAKPRSESLWAPWTMEKVQE